MRASQFNHKYDAAAKQMLAVLIGASAASQTGKNARCWTFATDELQTKTNAVFSSSAYSSVIASLVSGGTGIGNMTNYGGLAAAFDSVTVQALGSSCAKSISTAGFNNFVGKDWGEGTTKQLQRIKIYTPSNGNLVGNAATSFKIQGSNDGFASEVIDLYSGSTTTGTAQMIDIISGIVPGFYRYHRIAIYGNGSSTAAVAELQFYETTVGNLTLVPTALSVASAPTRMTVFFLVQPVDAITLNTDIMVEASRDGGMNWTYGNLRLVEAYDATYGLYKADFTTAALPVSGTSLLWRLISYNNKQINVRGAALFWEL